MNLDNIEYWVLQSMHEAQVSLQSGEVPVGCLFLIQKATLEILTKDVAQCLGNESLELIGKEGQLEENLDENGAKKSVMSNDTELPGSLFSDLNVSHKKVVEPSFEESLPSTKSNEVDGTEFSNVASSEKGVFEHCTRKDISITKANDKMGDTASGRHPNESFEKHSFKIPGVSPVCKDNSGGYVIIARGKNEVNATKNATRHAELVCIDHIFKMYHFKDGKGCMASVFENSTVIVNVEPCIMCMAALLDLNVKCIVFTCLNDRFGYNVLGNEERTNYFEIVELNGGNEDSKQDLKELKESVKDSEELEGNFKNTEEKRLQNVEIGDNLEANVKILDSFKEASTVENAVEDLLVDPESLPGAESERLETSIDIIHANPSTQYQIKFKNITLLATGSETIMIKVSRLLEDKRRDLCNVFHYRKYESETMNILKLFYKGTNPNAPKNKVKIKY